MARMLEMVTKEELLVLVRRIRLAQGTEAEIDALVRAFQASVPHPGASNLIYWHEPELTDEEIVEQAMSYQSKRL